MKVTIIGAGIAGLYTAYILEQHGIEVELIEASQRAGGRIMTHQTEGHLYELGAEYIHGKHSVLYEMAEHIGLTLLPEPETTYYWYQGKLLSEPQAEQIQPINQWLAAIENQWQYQGEEKSVHSWFADQPFFNETRHLLEAWAAEYGTNSHRLGMSSLAQQERLWQSGTRNFRIKEGFGAIVHWFGQQLKTPIKFGCKALAIDYSGSMAEVLYSHKAETLTITAHKVVVTVPLPLLQENALFFNPPLPAEKQAALQEIGSDNGVKVFLRFESAFWPANMTDAWGGELCAAYTANPKAAAPVLCAYLMGENARKYKSWPQAEQKAKLLAEIGLLFGAPSALTYFVEQDWGNDPLVKGAYSFASLHSTGQREKLFEPLEQKVFFAGEACHFEGHAATVHGAMQTAEWVASELLQAQSPA